MENENKIFLMNSAMMPQSGSYIRRDISAVEFRRIFLRAKEIVSTVAYPQIQEVVGKALGLEIPIDRSKKMTVLDEQSTILVVKLQYRVPSAMKGRSDLGIGQSFEDYEYCLIQYSS